jgi:2'-5' RNA ligase
VHAPFSVRATGLVTMPDRARVPSVLALALADDGRLGAFARDVDEAMAGEGFERESRAFRPHVTLARIRAPRGWREFRPVVEALRARAFGAGEIDAVTLFSSALGAGPARYDAIAVAKLGGAGTRDGSGAAFAIGARSCARDPHTNQQ